MIESIETEPPAVAAESESSAQSASPPALARRETRALALPDAVSGRLSDREFLAPALEILETPASPVHLAFLWII